MRTINVLLICILFSIQVTCTYGVRLQGMVRNASANEIICTIVGNELSDKPVKVTIPLNKGKFDHYLDLTSTTFLSFSDGSNYFGGFVQPGDSIVIHYDQLNFDNTITYSGFGSEKFDIAYSINQIKSFPRKLRTAARDARFPIDYLFGKIDSLKTLVANQIALAANQMSEQSNLQLRGFLAANVLHAKYNGLVTIFGDSYDDILKKHREKLSAGSIEQMHQLLEFDENLYRSKFYVTAVNTVMSIYLEENIQPKMAGFAEQKYQYLIDKLPQNLRSPVIFMMLSSDISYNKGSIENSVFIRASDLLDDSRLRHIIVERLAEAGTIRVGGKAPEFSLLNLSGQKVNLASFSGKTIYLDFWFAACGPCHLLFKAIQPVKKYFENDDRVVFLTVSIDGENEWKKAITKFNIIGYHAFTENKFRDHPILQSYQVNFYPTTYIIDPKGEFHSVNPSGNPEILKQQILESLNVQTK